MEIFLITVLAIFVIGVVGSIALSLKKPTGRTGVKKSVLLVLMLSAVLCISGCGNEEIFNEDEDVRIDITDPEEDETDEEGSLYYKYALEHDDKFWEINKDWMDEKKYYYLGDVDHDGEEEMIVKVGCGVGVYKVIDGIVAEIFYDCLPQSSGRDAYWLARYNGEDYICYTSAGSSECNTLNIVKEPRILEKVSDSVIIDFDEYMIYGEYVTKEEYDEYVNSIEYPTGMTIDGLR